MVAGVIPLKGVLDLISMVGNFHKGRFHMFHMQVKNHYSEQLNFDFECYLYSNRSLSCQRVYS